MIALLLSLKKYFSFYVIGALLLIMSGQQVYIHILKDKILKLESQNVQYQNLIEEQNRAVLALKVAGDEQRNKLDHLSQQLSEIQHHTEKNIQKIAQADISSDCNSAVNQGIEWGVEIGKE